MTRDDILRMAHEAGFDFDAPTKYEHAALLNRAKHDLPAFERFAALVAAAEREECAKVCDITPPQPFRPSIEAAHAIRARGTK